MFWFQGGVCLSVLDMLKHSILIRVMLALLLVRANAQARALQI